jgi:hypothetical protein
VGSDARGSICLRFFLTNKMVAPIKLSIARPASATMVVAASFDISIFLPLLLAARVELECNFPGEGGSSLARCRGGGGEVILGGGVECTAGRAGAGARAAGAGDGDGGKDGAGAGGETVGGGGGGRDGGGGDGYTRG